MNQMDLFNRKLTNVPAIQKALVVYFESGRLAGGILHPTNVLRNKLYLSQHCYFLDSRFSIEHVSISSVDPTPCTVRVTQSTKISSGQQCVHNMVPTGWVEPDGSYHR